MKQILNFILTILVAVLFTACHKEEVFDAPMNEGIILDLSSNPATRASSTSVESFVSHLDVFIFEDNSGSPGNGASSKGAYFGRYDVNNRESVTLNAKRSSFGVNAEYHVYIIANSNINVADFESVKSYNNLLVMRQEDYNLHITGLAIENAPKYFLMDAKATDASDGTTVTLYNGNSSDNTTLSATLRRAAAKVVINITADESVEFKPFTLAEGSDGGLYYIRNLPIEAYLLAEARDDETIVADKDDLRNTGKANNEYFSWNPESNNKKVSLITYVYPNAWAGQSLLDHETCVVMNLPLSYTDAEGNVADYHNSWYKIPMSGESMFRRNNYYEVNINLDRPGAISESTPVDIENTYYKVEDWIPQEINVGGEDKPAYLMVNRQEMEMRNIEVDATTLEFSSSSPVTVSVKTVSENGRQVPEIYYYNKYGVKTYITPTITGTTEGGIQGNITVSSPNPDNNTIRYFTLVVTNEDGISKEVAVRQYPLVFISNILSYYSYRSDFLGDDPNGTGTANHYENRSSYSRFAVNYTNGAHSYSANNGWSDMSAGFFVSKYVNNTYTSGNNQGLSDVNYYSSTSTGNFNDPYNARMYHIQITETSGEYVLGKPKITNGVTDPGEDNARMVSPSFMIASRLGTLTVSRIDANNDATYLDVYAEHAKQYVEVYVDPETGETIHLSDWRLPTEAELEIIYQYQGNANVDADAMDYLLNAGYYFSASGPVANPKANSTGKSVRCVRDVY